MVWTRKWGWCEGLFAVVSCVGHFGLATSTLWESLASWSQGFRHPQRFKWLTSIGHQSDCWVYSYQPPPTSRAPNVKSVELSMKQELPTVDYYHYRSASRGTALKSLSPCVWSHKTHCHLTKRFLRSPLLHVEQGTRRTEATENQAGAWGNSKSKRLWVFQSTFQRLACTSSMIWISFKIVKSCEIQIYKSSQSSSTICGPEQCERAVRGR